MSRRVKLRLALNQVRLTMVLLGCLLALSDDAADTYSQRFPEKFQKAWSANSGLFYWLLRTYLLEYPWPGRLPLRRATGTAPESARPTRLPFGNSFPMLTEGEHGRGRRAVSCLGSRQARSEQQRKCGFHLIDCDLSAYFGGSDSLTCRSAIPKLGVLSVVIFKGPSSNSGFCVFRPFAGRPNSPPITIAPPPGRDCAARGEISERRAGRRRPSAAPTQFPSCQQHACACGRRAIAGVSPRLSPMDTCKDSLLVAKPS